MQKRRKKLFGKTAKKKNGKTTVLKIRAVQGSAHQTLGKFDQTVQSSTALWGLVVKCKKWNKYPNYKGGAPEIAIYKPFFRKEIFIKETRFFSKGFCEAKKF